MKITVPVYKIYVNEFKKLALLSLVLIAARSSYGSNSTPELPGRQASSFLRSLCIHKDTIQSIQVNQVPGCKKYKIRLYPDAKHQVLFFSANGDEQKVYQLYMFDMEGKLVNQTSIRNRETTVLTNISEGNYLFEVFSNDQRIVNGKMTVN